MNVTVVSLNGVPVEVVLRDDMGLWMENFKRWTDATQNTSVPAPFFWNELIPFGTKYEDLTFTPLWLDGVGY